MKNNGENRIKKAFMEVEKNEFKMCGFEWCKKLSILYRPANVTSQHANTVFRSKFNSEHFLFEAFFIYSVLFAAYSTKVNLLSHCRTL